MSEVAATLNAPAVAAPAVAAPAVAAPAVAAPAIAWMPDADSDTVGFVQNKAWAGPGDSVKAYRELEKFVGADRAGRAIVLPTSDTPQDWNPVFDKLGRPTSADGYKLPVPEGQPDAFAKAAAEKFHEFGLTLKQGQALATWWNEQAGGAAKAESDAAVAKFEAEKGELAKLWGSELPMRTELARRAAAQYGISGDVMDTIEKAAGYSKVMQLFAKLGDTLREHGAAGLGDLGSFGMTPEGAKARLAQVKAQAGSDPNFAKRLYDPASSEWAEVQKLNRIISGG